MQVATQWARYDSLRSEIWFHNNKALMLVIMVDIDSAMQHVKLKLRLQLSKHELCGLYA